MGWFGGTIVPLFLETPSKISTIWPLNHQQYDLGIYHAAAVLIGQVSVTWWMLPRSMRRGWVVIFFQKQFAMPRWSMYGIFSYMIHECFLFMVNVGKWICMVYLPHIYLHEWLLYGKWYIGKYTYQSHGICMGWEVETWSLYATEFLMLRPQGKWSLCKKHAYIIYIYR